MTAPYVLAPPPLAYDLRDQTEFRRAIMQGAANTAASLQRLQPAIGTELSLRNFRILSRTPNEVTFSWDENLQI